MLTRDKIMHCLKCLGDELSKEGIAINTFFSFGIVNVKLFSRLPNAAYSLA